MPTRGRATTTAVSRVRFLDWRVGRSAHWSVRAPIGSGATSIIEAQLDGCVIQENWLPHGRVAREELQHLQHGHQHVGAVLRRYARHHHALQGRFKDDGNLFYEADQFGTANKLRMTFFNQGPNQVRQLGHISTDGGKTWTVTFDLTYVRKKTPEHDACIDGYDGSTD